MPAKVPIPSVHKIVFRADFAASLDYMAVFTNLAAQLKGYALWEVDGVNVTLRDIKKRCSAALSPGAFIYEQDSGDEPCAAASLDAMLNVWPKGLSISMYKRLGLRKKYLIHHEGPYEQLVALVNSKIFRLEELKLFLPTIGDSALRFDCTEPPYAYHVSVGPVYRDQIFAAMEFNRSHLDPQRAGKDAQSIRDTYPQSAFFLDVDFFQFGGIIKAEDVNTFLIAGRQRLEGIAQKWSDFLFGIEKA